MCWSTGWRRHQCWLVWSLSLKWWEGHHCLTTLFLQCCQIFFCLWFFTWTLNDGRAIIVQQHCYAVLSVIRLWLCFSLDKLCIMTVFFYTSIMDLDYHPIIKVWEGDKLDKLCITTVFLHFHHGYGLPSHYEIVGGWQCNIRVCLELSKPSVHT